MKRSYKRPEMLSRLMRIIIKFHNNNCDLEKDLKISILRKGSEAKTQCKEDQWMI